MTDDVGSPNQFSPKLPELDNDAVAAVKSFLPGKLLGRTAAFLASVVLVIAYVNAANFGLKPILGTDLPIPLSVYYSILIGLPATIVTLQLALEFRAKRIRRIRQCLAVRTGVTQSGYFRVGPYLGTDADRAKFDRTDQAHHKALAWIERSDSIPLYLTGDSGSGKSSLMNAFVLPMLRERGWVVIELRAWQDATQVPQRAFFRLPDSLHPSTGGVDLADLLASTELRTGSRFLVVLDQFEEFLILARSEQRDAFRALVESLRTRHLCGLTLLLVLRSDYQTQLGDFGLPPLRQGENFLQVGRFTLSAGREFLEKSQLDLQSDALDRLLMSASELDDTPGLVRPITLNMIGFVLASGRLVAPTLDAGLLVRRYIEQIANQPAIRNLVPSILEWLVTEQGTKRPRSEAELSHTTGLSLGEVRAALVCLGDAALTRPLDAAQGTWELSHDFVARAVARYLGRQRRNWLRYGIYYVSPALLGLMLLIFSGNFFAHQAKSYQLRSELADLGIIVTSGQVGLTAKARTDIPYVDLAKAGAALAELGRVRSLDLSGIKFIDLEPLRGLGAIERLNLSDTEATKLDPLEHLTTLQMLSLANTKVIDLSPLKKLGVLRQLNLSWTEVTDLKPLAGLTELRTLNLTGTTILDLTPLRGLNLLESIDLECSEVLDLDPLNDMSALKKVNLKYATVFRQHSFERLLKLNREIDSEGLIVRLDAQPSQRIVQIEKVNPLFPPRLPQVHGVPEEKVIRSRSECRLIEVRRALEDGRF